MEPTYTKAIRYDRETGDFAYLLNGEIVGYAASHLCAEQKLNELVYDLLRRGNTGAADTPAAVTDPAPAAVNVSNITRQTVAAVLVDARRKVADNRRWANALAKASTELEASTWYFTGQVLVIASRTTAGKRYRVTGQTCECSAHSKGNPCWHRAAHRLLVKAAQQQPHPSA